MTATFNKFLVIFLTCLYSPCFSSNNFDSIISSATNSISDCGNIYTGSTAQIIYKLGQPLVAHERCVWVVENSWAGQRIFLTLEDANFTSESDFLEVYEANFKEGSKYMRKSKDFLNLISPAFVIIVLKTGNVSSSTGFDLTMAKNRPPLIPNPFPFQGRNFLYNSPNGLIELDDMCFVSNWGQYTWTINPRQDETKLTIVYYNNVYSINLYSATARNATPLGTYDQVLTPTTFVLPSNEPIIIVIYARDFACRSGSRLQLYWNLDIPPQFNHTWSTTTMTTTTPSPSKAGMLQNIPIPFFSYLVLVLVLIFYN